MSTQKDATGVAYDVIHKKYPACKETTPAKFLSRLNGTEIFQLITAAILHERQHRASVTIHTAVIEYTEDMDPSILVSPSLGGLHQLIRADIEATVSDDYEDVVAEYVAEHKDDGAPFTEWHDALHELDGTPWVTIEQKEVAL